MTRCRSLVVTSAAPEYGAAILDALLQGCGQDASGGNLTGQHRYE